MKKRIEKNKDLETVIVIPSYNEIENIKKLIPSIFSIVPNSYIIVVDDSSPDGTREAVSQLSKKYKNLHLISRKNKSGRGSAVIEGFRYAIENIKPKFFIEMDADLSHNPREILTMLKLSKPKTIVVGSRYIKGSKMINIEIKRRILSYLSNLLIKVTLANPLVDNTNGFRCYRKDAIRCLLKHRFISNGYIVLSESTTLLYKKGFSFIEFPTVFVNRIKGKSNTSLSEFIHSLINLVKIKVSL